MSEASDSGNFLRQAVGTVLERREVEYGSFEFCGFDDFVCVCKNTFTGRVTFIPDLNII